MIKMKSHAMKEHQEVTTLREQGLGRYEIARITGIPLGTVGLWLRGTKPGKCLNKSREIFIKNLQIAHSKLQNLRDKKLNELSNKVTPDFSYTLGALLGDGYIYFNPNGGGHIRISVRDKDFAQHFYDALKNWSKLNCRIYKYRGFWRVYSSSVLVARTLKNFYLNKLKQSSRDIIFAFLKGLFDAEGGVNESSKRIRFYNSDINLINLVKELLEYLGIDAIKISRRKEEIHLIQGREVVVKPVYTLIVSRRKNLQLFYENIGFSIARKQKKLEKTLFSYQRNQIFWTQKEKEFLKNNFNRNYHWIANELGRPSTSVRKALYNHNLKPKIDNRLLS